MHQKLVLFLSLCLLSASSVSSAAVFESVEENQTASFEEIEDLPEAIFELIFTEEVSVPISDFEIFTEVFTEFPQSVEIPENDRSGLIEENGFLYYYEPDASLPYNGWLNLDGSIYYFSPQAATGWTTIDSEDYYFDPVTGVMQTGWININGRNFYLFEDGRKATGMQVIDGKTYYFNLISGGIHSGWVKEEDHWFFFDPVMVTGWQHIGTCDYYFDENGIMQTGWVNVNGRYFYLKPGGQKVYGAYQIDQELYYFNPISGGQQNGWVKLEEEWYYFSPAAVKGWQHIGTCDYYFNENGIMQTGWQTIDGLTYYLKPGGQKVYGLANIEGDLYYFYLNSGSMHQNGWIKENDHWYYFYPQALRGWQHIGTCDYYFDENCQMQTGWLHLEDGTYYLKPAGQKVSGLYMIDGITYQFDENGRLSDARGTLASVTSDKSIRTWNAFHPLSTSATEAISSAIKRYGSYQVSFTMVDILTGQGITYNPSLGLYSASSIKGPYEISVLNAGYSPTNYIYNAIKVSDNESYKYTRQKYGTTVFANWLEECGVARSQASSNYVTTSSLDLAKMWLHGWDYLNSDKANASWARSTFQGTNYSAINQTIGSPNKVYSKAGWIGNGGYYNVYNCAGIIDDGKHPYVLAIMSNCTSTAGISYMKPLVSALHKAHAEMVS